MLFITKQYINPAVSRTGIARLLKREGISRLTDLVTTDEGEKVTPKKSFKDYEPGFTHIDIKYLPPMPDETSRRYLFVAINRATRWVFMYIYGDMTEASSFGFLRWLKLAPPIKISKILTNNGSQFTAPPSPPKTRSPAASTPSMLTQPCLPNIDWRRQVTLKPPAWLSVSTDA